MINFLKQRKKYNHLESIIKAIRFNEWMLYINYQKMPLNEFTQTELLSGKDKEAFHSLGKKIYDLPHLTDYEYNFKKKEGDKNKDVLTRWSTDGKERVLKYKPHEHINYAKFLESLSKEENYLIEVIDKIDSKKRETGVSKIYANDFGTLLYLKEYYFNLLLILLERPLSSEEQKELSTNEYEKLTYTDYHSYKSKFINRYKAFDKFDLRFINDYWVIDSSYTKPDEWEQVKFKYENAFKW